MAEKYLTEESCKRSVRSATIIRLLPLVIFAVLLAGWLVYLRPQSLGGSASYVMIRGTSMLPHYRTGDLILLRQAPSYSVGEVIGYKVPKDEIGAGQVLVHRIVGGNGETGYILKGDNNKSPDPWRPKNADVVGQQFLVFPQLGERIMFIRQPVILAAAATAIAVPWVLFGKRRDEDEHGAHGVADYGAPNSTIPQS